MRTLMRPLKVCRDLLLILIGLSLLCASSWAGRASTFVHQVGRLKAFVVEPVRYSLTVMLLASQHGDEPAGTVTLEELIARRLWQRYPELRLVMVFPVNEHGYRHEVRFDIGGRDVNRHWLLVDTPINRELVGLMMTYEPQLVVDLHEARPRPDTDFMYSFPNVEFREEMSQLEAELYDELREVIEEALISRGFKPKRYYLLGSSRKREKVGGLDSPRVLRNYVFLRGSLGVLLESITSDELPRRVEGHVVSLEALLSWASANAQRIREALRQRREMWLRDDRVCFIVPSSYDELIRVLDDNHLVWFSPARSRYVRLKGYEVIGYSLVRAYGEPCWNVRLREVRLGEVIGEGYRVYPSWAISGMMPQGPLLRRLLVPLGSCDSFFEAGRYHPRRGYILPMLIMPEEECRHLMEERIRGAQ